MSDTLRCQRIRLMSFDLWIVSRYVWCILYVIEINVLLIVLVKCIHRAIITFFCSSTFIKFFPATVLLQILKKYHTENCCSNWNIKYAKYMLQESGNKKRMNERSKSFVNNFWCLILSACSFSSLQRMNEGIYVKSY